MGKPTLTHKTHGLLCDYFFYIFCNLMSGDFKVLNPDFLNYILLNIFYFVTNDFNLFRMPHFDVLILIIVCYKFNIQFLVLS